MALINRVKFDGDREGGSWLIYKFPSEDLVLGSQLIVNQGEEALFFRGGQALDVFGAGTHTLVTGNLPLLNKIVNLPYGGKTPFTAEVYYINKTSKLDMVWGTANPFQLEDPKYGLILSIRSHGKYGVRINDSRMFVSELVGAVPHGAVIDHTFVSQYFSGLLTSSIKSIISKFMIREKISFLEVTAYLKELSQECQNEITKEFDRFGVDIVNFYIETISPPKEDFEKLRTYKEELSMGANFYQQRRSFDVMETLAGNEGSGGLASAGMGLGFGMSAMRGSGDMFSGVNQGVQGGQIPQGGQAQLPVNGESVACPTCSEINPKGQKFCGKCGSAMVVGISCPACGKVNDKSQKFCGDCGGKLANICGKCGKENDFSQKFCGNCGNPL